MMFKTTLLAAALASSSAAALSSEQTASVSKAAAAAQALHQQFKSAQSAQSRVAAQSAKQVQLSSKKTALSARGAARSLRGKGGKGKGKGGKDDDEEDEEGAGEQGGNAPATLFLTLSTGMCAGDDFGGSPLAEDLFMWTTQMKSNSCFNQIDTDGFASSSKYVITQNPFAITVKAYSLHDCLDDNYVTDIPFPTDSYTFGGAVSPDGVCTNIGGSSARISISETPLQFPNGVVVRTQNSYVNQCSAPIFGGDSGMYESLDMQLAAVPFLGSMVPLCQSEYDSETFDTTYFTYDLSACGDATPTATINVFSDPSCSVPVGSSSLEAQYCSFDLDGLNSDIDDGSTGSFMYASDTCFPPAV